MITIKTLITCITLITGSFAFARGGTGGGGVLAAMMKSDSKNGGGMLSVPLSDKLIDADGSDRILKAEYVRFIRKVHGEIEFEYSQEIRDKEFRSQIFKLRTEEFKPFEEPYLKSILESELSSDWIKVNNQQFPY